MGRESLEPHELIEREDFEGAGRRVLNRRIALTVGVLAAITSFSALESETTVAESLLEKNAAVLAQSRASDEWAYRQAKSIKLHLQDLAPGPPADVAQTPADTTASEERARVAERERDEANRRSDDAFEAHHRFARATNVLQIAIVLESVSAVLGSRTMWLVGMVVGGVGFSVLSLGWR
jgi:predicted cobalt transporter CbtA